MSLSIEVGHQFVDVGESFAVDSQRLVARLLVFGVDECLLVGAVVVRVDDEISRFAVGLDRDANAAVNIMLAAGLAESLNACGGDVNRKLAMPAATSTPMKQETSETIPLH